MDVDSTWLTALVISNPMEKDPHAFKVLVVNLAYMRRKDASEQYQSMRAATIYAPLDDKAVPLG